MTLSQAAKLGISRIRLQMWGENTYSRIDLIGEFHGPWMHLYDRTCQSVLGSPTPQTVLCANDTADGYEEYHGELDQADAIPQQGANR